MRKKKTKILIFAALTISLIGLAANSDLRQVLINKVAFGYGGGGGGILLIGHGSPRPRTINSINAPANMTFSQSGVIKMNFDDWNKASLNIGNNTVDRPADISINRIGNLTYEIRAMDKNGVPVHFSKPVAVRIFAPFPANLSDFGLYNYLPMDRKWQRMPDIVYRQYSSEIFFSVVEPGIYRLMPISLANSFNEANFQPGDLIRCEDRRIFVVTPYGKEHIRTLWQLLQFRGQPINNLPCEVVSMY